MLDYKNVANNTFLWYKIGRIDAEMLENITPNVTQFISRFEKLCMPDGITVSDFGISSLTQTDAYLHYCVGFNNKFSEMAKEALQNHKTIREEFGVLEEKIAVQKIYFAFYLEYAL